MDGQSNIPDFDYRSLRGILAAQRITHRRFAQACGVSWQHMAKILTGTQPGELARIKIQRGMQRLGLQEEAGHAA